jgi:hypothetical protein
MSSNFKTKEELSKMSSSDIFNYIIANKSLNSARSFVVNEINKMNKKLDSHRVDSPELDSVSSDLETDSN